MLDSNSLHDYMLLKELGIVRKRKFNQVFLGEHKDDKHLAIIKILQKTNQHVNIQDFLRNEANFSFQNPFLPQILDFGENENEIYLIKKYQKGIQLDEFWDKLKKKEQIPFLLLFLKKIESIFEVLTEKNIIHCDIKASNFIINGRKEEFDVYLIDFGLSFYANQENYRKTIFPLAYASPEIILNNLHLASHKSDLFSLGILIYHLLEGRLPFYHQNPALMTNLQLTYPLQKSDTISNELFDILSKMCFKGKFTNAPKNLKKEEIEHILLQGISKRYASLKEINQDLGKIDFRKKSFKEKLIKIFSNPKVKGEK
ncbi:MAG: protein kinase [Bacteroidota bacterium]